MNSIPIKLADKYFLYFAGSWLLFVCLFVNYSALSGYWRWDDSSVLFHINKFSIIDDFFSPEIWREFSRTNLMPWMAFSYELDLILFGLRPSLFYFHHLLSLFSCAISLYFLLRFWVRKRFALIGATFFLLGAPSVTVAQQLMTRHYIEGLLFCLTSLIAFTLYLRKGGKALILISVVCYGLAVVSKEIYVPLVVLLVFMPEGAIRQRLSVIAPFILVSLVYSVWRTYMLGMVIGGYTEYDEFFNLSFIPEIITSFGNFPNLLFGSSWLVFCGIYIFLVGAYAYFYKSTLLSSLLVLSLILLPLIPLIRSPGIDSADRYLFLFWCAASFSIAFLSDKVSISVSKKVSTKRAELAIYGGLLVLLFNTTSSSLRVQSDLEDVALEFDVYGRFIWDNTDDVAFVPGGVLNSTFWYVTNLRDFKSRLISDATSPVGVPDDIFLASSIDALYTFDANCACMVDISNTIEGRRARFEESLNLEAPLDVEIKYEERIASWKLGPYSNGTYRIVSDVLGAPQIESSGWLGATIQDGSTVYVRYSSPEGWVTYSDRITIFHNMPTVNWHRE